MNHGPINEPEGSLNSAEDSRPLVSVVIPAHNAAEYIAATLDSVYQQTFSGYEVILVNDGSPDTPALEAALQPYLARLRYFQQENRGPSAARNLGIREARGRYVALLDSDDLWLPQHLERQIDSLARHAELGLIYANNLQFGATGVGRRAFETVPQAESVTLESLLAERCTVNTSSVVASRDALLRAGLFDETLNRCEDFDLWLRMACQGVRMAYDREVQVKHRLGQGLSSNSRLMKEARAEVYRKAARTLPLSVEQQSIVAAKLKELEIEIEIEAAKEHLGAGQFREARSAVHRANSLAPAARLDIAEIGLQHCPRLVRWLYERYIQGLQWYKLGVSATLRRSVPKAANFSC